MASAVPFDDQRDAAEDEFGDIIKTRTGRTNNKIVVAYSTTH